MVQLLGYEITRANDDKEEFGGGLNKFSRVGSSDDGTTTISMAVISGPILGYGSYC